MAKAWMNMYAQGYYHRVGKPGTLNLHPGDLYETEEEALADVDKNAPYLCTVSVGLPHGLIGVFSYPEDSVPTDLEFTKQAFAEGWAQEGVPRFSKGVDAFFNLKDKGMTVKLIRLRNKGAE